MNSLSLLGASNDSAARLMQHYITDRREGSKRGLGRSEGFVSTVEIEPRFLRRVARRAKTAHKKKKPGHSGRNDKLNETRFRRAYVVKANIRPPHSKEAGFRKPALQQRANLPSTQVIAGFDLRDRAWNVRRRANERSH